MHIYIYIYQGGEYFAHNGHDFNQSRRTARTDCMRGPALPALPGMGSNTTPDGSYRHGTWVRHGWHGTG